MKKLTEEQIAQLKKDHSYGIFSIAELAQKYDVTERQVLYLIHGRKSQAK